MFLKEGNPLTFASDVANLPSLVLRKLVQNSRMLIIRSLLARLKKLDNKAILHHSGDMLFLIHSEVKKNEEYL